jgi:hypothetical protein
MLQKAVSTVVAPKPDLDPKIQTLRKKVGKKRTRNDGLVTLHDRFEDIFSIVLIV